MRLEFVRSGAANSVKPEVNRRSGHSRACGGRATCIAGVGCGCSGGQVQRRWRCAVRGVWVGAVFFNGLRWRVRAARRGCAVRTGVWRVRSFVTVCAGACARRDWGALCAWVFSGWFGFRRVLVRSVLCSRGSGSTLGCWRSDPRSRQLRGVYRAWCRLFGWLGCELPLLRPHFNVYLTLFYGRSVVLCV